MAVVPHKQIFHCFVCGTGGDFFKFVELYHKMTKGETLRMLAQRAGIKLPELPRRGGGGGGPEKDKDGLTPRERIANTNEWACTFFEKHLRTPSGKAGLDYFYRRGLTDETIAKFRLGMSPDGWTGMVNAAMRLGISTENLAEAGLIKQRQDSSPYDAFRNRVIFPIIDATGGKPGAGRVIAFGGRILEEKRDEAGNVVEAKYLNSPDSRLFNKSESLYGLNLARQQIIRTRTAIVVEGYMDVIACHQAGVTNVIATLGTALTPDHARILKNYAQTIVLVFDSDDAGRRAADRALEVFVRGSLDVKLAAVPDGKDPCDFCMKHAGDGGAAFQKLVDAGADALTYKWESLKGQFHANDSITARQEAITTFLRYVAAAMENTAAHTGSASAMDPVRRGLLMAKIAGLVSLPMAELQTTLKKLAQQSPANAYRPGPNSSGSAGAPTASSNAGAFPNPGDVIETDGDPHAVAVAARVDIRTLKGLDAAEGWLLGALLTQPALYEKVRNDLSLSLFQTFHALANVLIEYFDNHSDLAACSLAELTTTLEESGNAAPSAASELVRQAIELEQKTSEWLEPSNLSPNHAKLLQLLTTDRGLTLETLVLDHLKELQSVRWGGKTDPAVDSDFAAEVEPASDDPEGTTTSGQGAGVDNETADVFKQIAQIKSRNSSGGNRRIIG